MSKRKIKFEATKHINEIIRMTTASGFDTEKSRGYTINVTIFDEERNDNQVRGAWEIYSDDESCYGEGTLSFEGNKCFDYDGCFDLSHQLCDLLTQNGYDMSEVDSRLF